jgi:hypothetical protein
MGILPPCVAIHDLYPEHFNNRLCDYIKYDDPIILQKDESNEIQIDKPKMKEEETHVKEEIQTTEPLECVVCLDAMKTHAIVPCGHLCLCESCSTRIRTKCPICTRSITDIIKIYM